MASNNKNTTAVDSLSFEQALKELEQIVGALEGGNIELEKAVASYSRGAELKAYCQKKLDEAKLQIKTLSEKDGVISAQDSNTNSSV